MNSIQFIQKNASSVPERSIQAVLELAAEGATVPFIARYRKDRTGNLDEVQIRAVIDASEAYAAITHRRDFILKEITEQGNLTSALKVRIENSWDLGELEEIYRPFKKKKKTKATIAREAGLEPFADWLWKLSHKELKDTVTVEVKAKEFLNVAKGFASYELVIKGAQDILVERIVNEVSLRQKVVDAFFSQGKVVSSRTKDFKPHSKYEMYAEFEEPVKSLLETKSSHRYMAMRRGWQEEELTVKIVAPEDSLLRLFEKFVSSDPESPAGILLLECAKTALSVYVIPSVTNDVHRALKEKSDLDSIRVFSENIKNLLMASPFGSRVVLGVDPGLKTGSKIALVDKSGAFLTHTVMHILGEQAHANAKKLFGEALNQLHIEAIAVGNGTAGRQTEVFLRKVLKELGKEVPVIMVNESGASVYSASDIAREEFPDLDVTVRGAISIARRLQDPLSELVKIDPKSIGVGQYQHDVNPTSLKKSLDDVVESCVNKVGVDLNTASASLLSYVSGIGPQLANTIVNFRKTQLFTERGELLKVPRFSNKTFEQAAGFLRIQTGKVFLDSTGIHPERYSAVREMAQELNLSASDLVGAGTQKLKALRDRWGAIIGVHTFDDIVAELEKPGRDPRDPFKVFSFRDDILEIKDLKEGMICPGIVTNVTNFGAFVDIGVHQDGLVHISELSNQFVDDPRKVVNPGDHVTVRVLAADLQKNQISLSMKLEAAQSKPARRKEENQTRQQAGAARNLEQKNPKRDQPRPVGKPQQPAFRGPTSSQKGFENRDRNQGKPGAPRMPVGGKPFNNPFAALAAIPPAPKKP